MTLQQSTIARNWRTSVVLLLSGQTLSLIGSSIVQYAIMWHLVMRTNSGVIMTITMTCAALPQAIVSLFGGVWADRWNRKVLIMVPDGLIAVATVVLSLSIANGADTLALFFVILVIRSIGAGVQIPAVQSFIPDITPKDKLLRINSINGTIQSLNTIASPAIAAALIAFMPLWAILYVDVTTATIGIIFIAFIRTQYTQKKNTQTASESASSILKDMREGLHYSWHYPRIRGVFIAYAVACFINIAPLNLTLLLMTRGFEHQQLNLGFTVLETASDKLAANEIAWSLGMVIGGALLSTIGAKIFRNNIVLLAIAFIGMGIFTALLGLSPTLLIYLIIVFLVGFSTSLGTSPAYTLLQQETDVDMQGRVFGLLSTVSGFSMPIGMLVFGPLADIIPVQIIFIIGGILTIPLGIWMLRLNARAPYQPTTVH